MPRLLLPTALLDHRRRAIVGLQAGRHRARGDQLEPRTRRRELVEHVDGTGVARGDGLEPAVADVHGRPVADVERVGVKRAYRLQHHALDPHRGVAQHGHGGVEVPGDGAPIH